MAEEINELKVQVVKLESIINYQEKHLDELKNVIESLKKEIDLKDSVILKECKDQISNVDKKIVSFERFVREQGEKTRWAVVKWASVIIGSLITSIITSFWEQIAK